MWLLLPQSGIKGNAFATRENKAFAIHATAAWPHAPDRCRRALRVSGARCLGLVGLLLAATRTADASGFYLTQQSVPAVGRATAGQVAVAEDAATVVSNPAGMTQLDGAQVLAGVSVLMPKTSFRDRGSAAATPGTGGREAAYPGGAGGNPFGPEALPNAYAALPLSPSGLWLGIGVATPFGLSLDYGSDWFGRYDSIESSLTTVDVAMAVAYRVLDGLSVGAGVNVQSIDVRLTSAIPDTLAPGGPSVATDGRNVLKGDDVSLGFNAGILATPVPGTRIGVHYRSAVTHTLKGRVSTSGLGGPLAAANGTADARADLRLPDILSAGVAQDLGSRFTLLAEAQWFNWSRFGEVRVRLQGSDDELVLPQDYRDAWAFAAAGEYRWSDDLELRAGVRYETTPTSDRFRSTGVPEGNNYSAGLGLSYRLLDNVVVDLAAFHTRAEAGNVSLSRSFFTGTPAEGRVTVKGRARTHATTAGFGLRYGF
jgi:long-chain fatty acid transport protein